MNIFYNLILHIFFKFKKKIKFSVKLQLVLVLVSDLSLNAEQNIFKQPGILLANWISHYGKKF